MGQWGCHADVGTLGVDRRAKCPPLPVPPLQWDSGGVEKDKLPPPHPCCGDGSRPQQTEGPPPSPPPLLQWDSGGVLGMRAGQPRLGAVGQWGCCWEGKEGTPPPLYGGWVEDGGRPPWLGADRGATPPPPTSPLQWDSRGCCGDGSKASPG